MAHYIVGAKPKPERLGEVNQKLRYNASVCAHSASPKLDMQM
jgi:hypothetical protein